MYQCWFFMCFSLWHFRGASLWGAGSKLIQWHVSYRKDSFIWRLMTLFFLLRRLETEPLSVRGGRGTAGLHNRGLVSLCRLTVHVHWWKEEAQRLYLCMCACWVLSWDFPLPSAQWLILPGYRGKTSPWTITNERLGEGKQRPLASYQHSTCIITFIHKQQCQVPHFLSNVLKRYFSHFAVEFYGKAMNFL